MIKGRFLGKPAFLLFVGAPMCWSSTADVVAGSGIASLGTFALTQVRRRRDLPLAALPLILGTHQLIEAVVWQAEAGQVSAGIGDIARTVWAIIALPLLPALVPSAILSAVGRPVRLLPFVVVGLCVSAILSYDLATGSITSTVEGHTLVYGVGIDHLDLVLAGYFVATLGSPLACGDRDLRLFGAVTAVGAAPCAILWTTAFASTWCAFAALVSSLVLRWLISDDASYPGIALAGRVRTR